MDWNVAATLLLAAVLFYDRRGARHVAPQQSIESDLVRRLEALENDRAAMRVEWTNVQLQIDRTAKRLTRYADTREPAAAAGAEPARRMVTLAELQQGRR